MPLAVSGQEKMEEAGFAAPLNPLIGRDDDLCRMRALLATPSVRLITLTGVGGVGKSRLAYEVAIEAEERFPGGVVVVELETVNDTREVLPAILRAIGSRSPEAGPVLVVLDNFEHVIDAAIDLARLLGRFQHVKAVVTSRTRLRLRGEHEVLVKPLGTPDSADLNRETAISSASVALFVERARATDDTFVITDQNAATVAALCRRLDGVPLALELAAMRAKVLTPDAMLRALNRQGDTAPLDLLDSGPADAPHRQRSFRRSLAWSHQLLSVEAQQVFRALAIFDEGCSLAAVDAVHTALHGTHTDLLEILESLVEHSVVIAAKPPMPTEEADADLETRFSLLATYRDFGRELLVAADAFTLAQRAHAEHYRALVESLEDRLTGPAHAQCVERLSHDAANVRAAFEWSIRNESTGQLALRIASSFWRYWNFRSSFAEGRSILGRALAGATSSDHTRAYANALLGAGVLAWYEGENRTAEQLVTESVARWREIGETRGLAFALASLGQIEIGERNLSAWSHLEESVALFRLIDDRWGLAFALNPLGFAAMRISKYDAAALLLEESQALFTDLGDRWGVGLTLMNLGRLAFEQRTWDRAQEHLEHSLEIFRGSDPARLGAVLNHLGELYLQQGRGAAAEVVFLESAELNQRLGHRMRSAFALRNLGILAGKRHDDVAQRDYLEASLARSREINDEWSALLTLQLVNELDAGSLGDSRGGDPVSLAENDMSNEASKRDASKDPKKRTGLPAGLTEREVSVLRLLTGGKSNREIAEALTISPATAASHVRNIFSKIDVSNRVDAAMYASRHGFGPQT